MGLDGVEIVMEVEEHFGVSISDDEAGGVRTVGDMVDLIEARVKRREATGCLSLPWFLKVRRLARDVKQQPGLRLRPATRVADVLHPNERKMVWRGLKELVDLPLGGLRRPSPIMLIEALMVVASPILLFVSLATLQTSLAIASVAFAFGAWVLMVITRPLKTVPPKGYETFGEITQRLVGLEAAAIGYPTNARELIFADLALIVSEQLGVDLEKVKPEARFVEDLNIG
jgi:acyl carrier protein